MQLSNTYKFSLSSLLEGYLQCSLLDPNNGKYFLKNSEDVSELSKNFINKMLEDCDIYMTIGAYRDPNGNIYTNRGSFRRGWRNVFKLTESEFWDKCFTN